MGRPRALRTVVALIVILLGVAISAPTGGAVPVVNLSIWGGYPEIAPVYQRAADAYQQAHPNVKVTVLTTDLRDYERKLAASLPSDTAGNVLEVEASTVERYLEAGLIPKAPADLAQFVRSRSFNKSAQDAASLASDVYGVPWFAGVGALYYNTDMFKEAGLSGPPKTMDELMAFAKKLVRTDAQGRVARSGISLRLFGAGSGVAEKFAILMWPRGGELLTRSAPGKYRAGYDNDAGRATMKMHLDAVFVDKIDSLDIKHDAEAFELGQTAMFERESWVIGDIQKNAPTLKYLTAPIPRDKRWGTILGVVSLYVSRSAANPEVAWDFVKFLTQPQFERQLLGDVGWIPLRQDVNLDPVFAKSPQYKAFLVKDKDYVYWSMPSIKDFDEIETKLASRLVAAYRDRTLAGNPAAIASMLHAAAEETNGILKRDGLYGE
ncbi:MAG: extracellular solute-binding protein [Bacillati bacterium ANGP1]|uniref:Extracellular solute-binding protein n=1 Tax=Candidatus Segetimicrobium genomatis TaxID=2569760 RepID=A0A537K0N8_9BACT|nr:MAG: extracellular solute-binding protein [Terrabacteria group bacterium ANGP1]